MKNLTRVIAAVLVVALLSGCMAHTHVVGAGAQGNVKEEQRQWYVLWGLVPMNTVDSATMAGGSADYTIHTEQNFLDVVIGIFTSLVTIYPRTVTVTH
jgi:hypothetical protein